MKKGIIESKYDSIGNEVKFVAMLQLEGVYRNIFCACCITGKRVFGINMPKEFLLTTTLLTMVYVNDNYSDIHFFLPGFIGQ